MTDISKLHPKSARPQRTKKHLFPLKWKKICFRTQQQTLKPDNRGQVERQSEALFKATQAEAALDATPSVNF